MFRDTTRNSKYILFLFNISRYCLNIEFKFEEHFANTLNFGRNANGFAKLQS